MSLHVVYDGCLMSGGGVIPRERPDLLSSQSLSGSASSSSGSAFSAQKRPAWRANTPVRATLQMRLLEARSSVALRRDRGKGSFSPCEGSDVNFAKISKQARMGGERNIE